MGALDVMDLGGRKYFIDRRLNQVRNVDNPHEYYDFGRYILDAINTPAGEVITGMPAAALLNKLLDCPTEADEKYGTPEERRAGVYYDEGANSFVAFDNRSGDCYVEEFPTIDKAILWATGEYEAEDLR